MSEENLEITPRAFDEISAKLRQIGYGHLFLRDSQTLDLRGIALVRGQDQSQASGGKRMAVNPEGGL